MTDPPSAARDGRLDGADWRPRDGRSRGHPCARLDRYGARIRGRRRDQGSQPVVVRAHAVLPPSARGRQPHRAAAVRRGRALRQAHRAVRVRRDRPQQPRSVHRPREVADAERLSHLRDRSARARLPEPDHLRHPDVALGGALRRDPRDCHRDCRRCCRRVLRRPHRQPADALHRPHPHAPGRRRSADRCRVPRIGRHGSTPHQDRSRSRSTSR